MKSVSSHSCQKGLAIIWPFSRRRESAYILSYQSLLSVSIDRASPEENYPKSAKEGLAQTSFRRGYQKRHIGPEFCQLQLADLLAALLFPYREGGIKLPTTLKRWQNPGKPGSGCIKQMPTRKQFRFLAVNDAKSGVSRQDMPSNLLSLLPGTPVDLFFYHRHYVICVFRAFCLSLKIDSPSVVN